MPGGPDNLVELTSVRTEFEAAAVTEALQAHRVRAEVEGGGHAHPGTPIRVMVRAADAKRARELLRFIQAQSMHLSWAQGPAPATSGGTRAPAPPSKAVTVPGAAAAPAARPAPAPHAHAHTHGSRRVPIVIAVIVVAGFLALLWFLAVRPETGGAP